MIQYLIILIILKVRHPGIRKHTADSVDGAQFLCVCLPHGIQVEIEMAADHLRVCKADPRDSETKDQPRQCGVGRSLCGLDEVLVGLLAESLHSHDGIPVTVQMKDIIEFMDESRRDELLKRHLGETIDI